MSNEIADKAVEEFFNKVDAQREERATGVHLSLRDAVRFKRHELGWSQRELAKLAGLSPAYVSALETGRIQPSLRAFAQLAGVLRFTGPELKLIMNSEAKAAEKESTEDE